MAAAGLEACVMDSRYAAIVTRARPRGVSSIRPFERSAFFRGGSGLVLHWYPDETEDGAVQVDPIAVPGMKVYQSSLHGGRGAFRSRSSYPVRPGTGESPLPAGKWRVSCRSDRCAEFFRAGEEEPRLRFWFRATPLLWVAASMEHTAGNALGTLIHPEGTLLLKSPARLARLLATGGPLHA